MTKQITSATVKAPGFFGLNSQDSSVSLSDGYATIATNCVIDKSGRIGARQGWEKLSATNSDLSTANIKAIKEVRYEGGSYFISAGNNKLFVGETTLTAYNVRNADNSGNETYTITDNHWQIATQPYSTGLTSSAHAYLVQEGHKPLVFHKLSAGSGHAHEGDYGFQLLADVGSLPAGYTEDTFKPNVALAAYGRVWYADIANDRQTVYFSDINDGAKLTTGTAGYLNIGNIVAANDPIVALGAHNGYLVIFCEKTIVVYSRAEDVSLIRLEDTINGTGCIARDSLVATGGDLIFLSDSGVKSFQRTIQEKSMPMRDISKNVRDELLADVNQETLKEVKGVYYEKDAFYLLALPTSQVVYCFDMRGNLQDGAARATTWNSIKPTAFCSTSDRRLLTGQAGYIGNYAGYDDDGSAYRMVYFTNYFDFGAPTTTKILKKIGFVFVGTSAQPVVTKWGFDYSTTYRSSSKALTGGTISEFGVAEYNIAEYSTEAVLSGFDYQAGGAGKILQIGIESDINGAPLSVQKIDVYVLQGKIK
jgi:hypothetical protein